MDALDVWHLAKQGVLREGVQAVIIWRRAQPGEWSITLACAQRDQVLTVGIQSVDGEGAPVYQDLALADMRTGFGTRVFWQCAACGRRVARVYRNAHYRFVCRMCLRLVYRSQHESTLDRLQRRLQKLRRCLGIPPAERQHSVWRYPKPRRMHYTTYLRLGMQAEDLRMQVLETEQREMAQGLSTFLTIVKGE
jgi:hypothetical protein